MLRNTRTTLLLMLALLVSSTAFAAEQKVTASKAALIREFLKVTDAREGTADAFIDILGGRLGLPMAPEGTRGEVRASEEMTEMAEGTQLELYDHFFTEQQLRDLISFFQTDTGQHYVQVARKIAAETRKNLQASTDRYLIETNERNRANRTRNDFRGLGVALKTYFADHGRYPNAQSVDELAGVLSPRYMAAVSKQDAWGHTIHYEVSDDGQHYRIVSAGTDGKFALQSQQDQSDDIVYSDGRFVHGGDPDYPQ